jgi:amidophosphoribosyltransferase
MLGKLIYDVRKNFGRQLAKEWGLGSKDIDVVIAVPETSQPMAIGFSQETGVPYEMGLQKNRYIQRTFINPDQKMRQQGVKMKMMPLPEVIAGKRVAVIDDSIVRGTTSREVVRMLFEAGAKEVHFLASSAPIRFPDFYGIDIPNQKDLLAFNKSVEEMREYLGSTSLHFLSVKGMIEATGLDASLLNTSCFTGTYPVDIHERAFEFCHPTEPIFADTAPHETVAIKRPEEKLEAVG